jgi:hypothetical protein
MKPALRFSRLEWDTQSGVANLAVLGGTSPAFAGRLRATLSLGRPQGWHGDVVQRDELAVQASLGPE